MTRYNSQNSHSHPLTIPDVANHSVRAKESCCFENQDSILAHHIELTNNKFLRTTLTCWQVIPFLRVNQLGNSISLSDSIMTEVFLPDFRPFLKLVLDLVPVHHESESPIFYDHHIKLDQFHTFESPVDKLASSHFYEIELNEKCDLDSQCDPV